MIVAALLLAVLQGPPVARTDLLSQPTAQIQKPESALEARTTEVARGLRCPVCQGVSIQDSPSELAQQMRALVREQLAAGKTPDEVRGYFISKYGEWILLAPEPKGFNLLAYLIPAVLLIGGALGIAVLVRRWTMPEPTTTE